MMLTLPPRSSSVPLLFTFALLAAALPGCRKSEMPPSTRPAPEVQVARPLVRQVTEYTYFTGRIEAPESVDIQTRVTGYLDTVDFVPGADVKKGQRLFLIDPRPYQA